MRTIDCREARPSLNAYLDGVLERISVEPIEEHLSSCAGCRAELAALRRTRSLLAEAGSVRAPEAWVREAKRTARGSHPARLGRRLSFASMALSTAAAAAFVIVAFVTSRLMVGGDIETPALKSYTDTRQSEPVPAPSAAQVREPGTAPGSPAPLSKSIAPPASSPTLQRQVASRLEKKDVGQRPATEAERAKDEEAIAAREADGAKGLSSSVDALSMKTAKEESASPGPGLPSYRVTLAQIHFPAARRSNEQGAVNSFTAAAPAPVLDKAAKDPAAKEQPAAPNQPDGQAQAAPVNEPASRAKIAANAPVIRAVAVVDPTGMILSARPVAEDADRRTRDFLAGLAGARVDLPGGTKRDDVADRPAGTAPSGTPAPSGAPAPTGATASARTEVILLEIVLDPGPAPTP